MLDRIIEPFAFFSASYLATLVVAAGCAYLGVYIALKRIVFIGIALAEISAAGIAFGFWLTGLVPVLGGESLSTTTLAASILFSLGGIALLAVPWAEKLRISRENVVGVGYAAGAAGAILLVWKSAGELDELKNILAGSSLYVTGGALRNLVIIFGAIGLVHVALRKEMIFCSLDPITARTLGLPARALDVLLYVTIGVAVAPALRTHGVLSVFGYIVIPPIGGLLVARRLGPAFYHSVAISIYGSALGLWVAAWADLPPGPATVSVLAALLVPIGICSRIPWLRTAYIAVEAAALVASLALAVVAGRAYIQDARAERAEKAAVKVPATSTSTSATPAPVTPTATAPEGPDRWLEVLGSDAPPFERSEALEALRATAGGDDRGYDPDKDAAANAPALERWREWRRTSR